jgi:hypothetical protein
VRLEGLGKLKTFSYLIGNRTSSLPGKRVLSLPRYRLSRNYLCIKETIPAMFSIKRIGHVPRETGLSVGKQIASNLSNDVLDICYDANHKLRQY